MDRKQQIREFTSRVLNGGDIDASGEYFHQDMVEEVPFPEQGPGVDGLKHTLRAIRTAFPDSVWTIDEQIAEADSVVSRFTLTGTHRGPFLGIPATGRPINVWGMVRDRFAGDKVASTRIIMDMLSLLIQLGVVPPPQSAE